MAQTVDGPTPAGEQGTAGSPAARTAPAAVTARPVAPPPPPPVPDRPAVATGESRARPALRFPRARPAQRRTRVTVRHVGPVSVLKFSLIFYFCVMLAGLLGLVFLYMILQAIGVIDSIEEWVTKIFPQAGGESFQVQPGYLFPRAFLIGCGMVVVWSFINLMAAFLYNLISDVVGGVEITLSEKK